MILSAFFFFSSRSAESIQTYNKAGSRWIV
jgi:hypothetical protein